LALFSAVVDSSFGPFQKLDKRKLCNASLDDALFFSTLQSCQRPLVTRLQGREKERIVQTRITQLAFIELLEGPEAAVNHSTQLLSLFGTLFQDLDLEAGETKVLFRPKMLPRKLLVVPAELFGGFR
jgi:hypothetical protein